MYKQNHKVLSLEKLTPETFIIHMSREQFTFQPGQYVVLRDPANGNGREYSIYSSVNDDKLSFLVREVEGGDFSRYLRQLIPGSAITVEGPKGFFLLDEKNKAGEPALFVATGTGISPFHSFVKSYRNLNYRTLHGVHFADEAYGKEAFNREQYLLCTSRMENGDYFGHVSSYLKEKPVSTDAICYLCGNSSMIEEVTSLLEEQGIAPENIRTEVFF